MIRSIDITNFRCFERLKIEACRRVNVIVGDNGAGKTALLESLFLALGSTSELALRFRQQRGIEGAFIAPNRKIEEAIWRDYYYNRDWNRILSVEIVGDGAKTRSVRIFRGASQLSIPFGNAHSDGEQLAGGVAIEWRDANGREHLAKPTVSASGIKFDSSDEDLPDFFYFAANQMPTSGENAGRFSELSQSGKVDEFIAMFTREYDWIEGLAVEVLAGAPVIYAKVKGKSQKIPLPNISGGINRMVGIMLAIASRSGAVVLVDEMEDGIYYKHHDSMWRWVLDLTRTCDAQLFTTTHSDEWIKSLVRVAGNNIDDIALWRLERNDSGQPELFEFSGHTLRSGIELGAEVRGGVE